MSFIFEITTGNIAEGVQYQVAGTGTGIIYNSVTYNVGDYFVGVAGVTDYTKNDGTEIVTEASTFLAQAIGVKDDFFLGKFSDESTFLGLGIGFENAYYPEQFTLQDVPQHGSNFINTEVLIKVPFLIPEITNIVGDELYRGVTFTRLKELETLHPEITLTADADDNINQIDINGITILIDINR